MSMEAYTYDPMCANLVAVLLIMLNECRRWGMVTQCCVFQGAESGGGGELYLPSAVSSGGA